MKEPIHIEPNKLYRLNYHEKYLYYPMVLNGNMWAGLHITKDRVVWRTHLLDVVSYVERSYNTIENLGIDPNKYKLEQLLHRQKYRKLNPDFTKSLIGQIERMKSIPLIGI